VRNVGSFVVIDTTHREREATGCTIRVGKAGAGTSSCGGTLKRWASGHVGWGDECVYNSADTDPSQIVWARDMGETKNRQLVYYYRGSCKIRLYQPDTGPGKLIPNESVSQ